jgi:hypothetical protein
LYVFILHNHNFSIKIERLLYCVPMIDVIISSVRAVFGKRLPYFLALLGVQIFVIIIVVIWTFEDSSGFVHSIYNLFVKNSGVFGVFNFIADYADIFSGLVVCIALYLLFISLRKYQRARAINRLHNWARNGVVVLAQYREHKPNPGNPSLDRFEELRLVLDKLLESSKVALGDAGYIGGEVNEKTKVTVEDLRIIRGKLAEEDHSLFDNLQELQHNFADTMIIVFELIK